jgi:hypothetical protein
MEKVRPEKAQTKFPLFCVFITCGMEMGDYASQRQAFTHAGVVATMFDCVRRVWRQSRPYRNGSESPQWFIHENNSLDRVTRKIAPDGVETMRFFDAGAPAPNGASPHTTSLRHLALVDMLCIKY